AEWIDEIGLFNPIYMFLQTGKMTYPIMGEFNTFTIHPPLRYFEIALLMKIGTPQVFADIAVPFFELVAAILIVLFSRLACGMKVVYMCALPAIVLFSAQYGFLSLRPEIEVVSSFACGIYLLETGRVANWNRIRLFAGAFFLTATSALQWFSIATFIGV